MAEYKKLEKYKIQLVSKQTNAFYQLTSSFSELLLGSQKTERTNNITGASFPFSLPPTPLSAIIKLKSAIPGSVFLSDTTPVELTLSEYHFFLLPDTILVFNKENKFITALEPMALVLSFKEKEKNVFISRVGKDEDPFNDRTIASDSKLVKKGKPVQHWLHQRNDGGPDMRYSINYRYESRPDTYAYTEFRVQIGNCCESFNVSKAGISHRMISRVKDYCSISHEANAVPSLLRLLEQTANNKEIVEGLASVYDKISNNMFCKEVFL